MVKRGSAYRFVTDQLGSVRLVVNVADGTIAQRIDYDAWGVPTLVVGTWDFQPFGFAGGLYDPDTGLVRASTPHGGGTKAASPCASFGGEMAAKAEALLRTQRILWAAQMGATALFVVVLVIQQRSGTLPTDPPFLMLPVFGAVAVVVFAVSFILPRFMLRGGLARANMEVDEVADDEPQLFRTAPKTMRLFADPDAALRRAMQLSQTPLILGIALGEAVAIFGLVLGMLGFSLLEVAPFFVGGWIAIASHFPRQGRIIRALEAAKGATLRQPTERS